MKVEIVAIGTELLLGQIIDTNSTWLAERLAEAGMDCIYQTRVGDNFERITEVLTHALTRVDAVITCGGLGPTQDDITRDALASVMGVELLRDDHALSLVREVFARRKRAMSPSNERQADVPVGAALIEQRIGTAPGLICPVGDKVIYSVPGVPDELKEMMTRAIVPDLVRRSGVAAVIRSRVLRTVGYSESLLSEIVAPRIDALENQGPLAPTLAFLASGIEGIKLRLTVKSPDVASANEVLDKEEAELRALLGDAVFGLDDETIEFSVGVQLKKRNLTIAVAESFTGGLIASRIVSIEGASQWFNGAAVTYATKTKAMVLGVPEGPVITSDAAAAMAAGVRERFGADVGLATTGVAGPTAQEGHPPGTGFVGIALPGKAAYGEALTLLGARNRLRTREIGALQSLDALRRALLALP